jgi:LAGLIDADG DNA endonuclease family
MYAQSGKPNTPLGQIEYFNLVFSYFSVFCTVNYTPEIRKKLNSINGETYLIISFATMQLVCLNFIHSLFYQNKTDPEGKIVPYNILDLLKPIGLAF